MLGFGQGDEDGGPEDGGQDHVEPAIIARKITSFGNFIARFILLVSVFKQIGPAELIHSLSVIDIEEPVIVI